MTQDVSGFGLQLRLIASQTFPAGVTLSAFADDADPLDIPEINVAETAMGLNGDLITWSKANPLKVTLNVIPGSDDDVNLGILLEANRVGRGKTSARDEVTLTAIYADGKTKTLTGGKIISGRPGQSVASSGRTKTKPYAFDFENLSGS